MALAAVVRKILGHPLAEGVRDVDDPSCRIPVHRQLIESKALLYAGYLHWYAELLPAYRETAHLQGQVVEVGCGPGFLEEYIPELVKTDSVPNCFAHKIMDAMQTGTIPTARCERSLPLVSFITCRIRIDFLPRRNAASSRVDG